MLIEEKIKVLKDYVAYLGEDIPEEEPELEDKYFSEFLYGDTYYRVLTPKEGEELEENNRESLKDSYECELDNWAKPYFNWELFFEDRGEDLDDIMLQCSFEYLDMFRGYYIYYLP